MQFGIDIGRNSGTDRMNEMKYGMKIILVVFNMTISNCIITRYINSKD
jgi:hypothetical protein